MNDVMIIVWAGVIAAALIIEFLTCDFSAVSFAVGGIVSLLLAALDVGLEWQIPVFVVVDALSGVSHHRRL